MKVIMLDPHTPIQLKTTQNDAQLPQQQMHPFTQTLHSHLGLHHLTTPASLPCAPKYVDAK